MVTLQPDPLLLNIKLRWSPDLSLLGPNGNSQLSLSVCALLGNRSREEEERVSWPSGNYCTFGIGNQCPPGMTSVTKEFTHAGGLPFEYRVPTVCSSKLHYEVI